MRPAANKKRFRILVGPCVAEARSSRTFHSEPVIQISGNIRLVAEIVKLLPQDVEMYVLEFHSELPWLAVRRNERRWRGRLTRGTAGVECRRRILCRRCERQAKKRRAQYPYLTHTDAPPLASQGAIALAPSSSPSCKAVSTLIPTRVSRGVNTNARP